MHYRVMNDMRKGEVMVDESGNIALQHYHNLLGCTHVVVNLLLAINALETKTVKPPASEVLIPLPDFGGDHAST